MISVAPGADPSYAPEMSDPFEDESTVGRQAVPRGAVPAALAHWWPLLGANLLWTGVALVVAAAVMAAPPAVVLLPLLAVPTAGVFRTAGRVVRETGWVSIDDALDAWRADVPRTLVIGAAFVVGWTIFALNVAIGTGLGSVLGLSIAIASVWALIGSWLLFWTLWPLLTDPSRIERPARRQLRLAALLVIADPIRIAVLGLAVGVLLVLSVITILPLVTVAMAASALIAGHVVLPAADRLEEKLAGWPAA